jgi:hypothetical protein
MGGWGWACSILLSLKGLIFGMFLNTIRFGIFHSVDKGLVMGIPKQGVSYSKKFRVKRGFPNYLEVAISQFRSAKK